MKRKLIILLMAAVLASGLSIAVYADDGERTPTILSQPIDSDEVTP